MPLFIAAAPQVFSSTITVSEIIITLSAAGTALHAIDNIVTSVNHILNN